MKTSMKMAVRLAVATVACWGLGCGRGEEADTADDAEQSVTSTSSESALTSEIADEGDQPVAATPTQLADHATTRLPGRFKPAGCAVVTQSGATVTAVLTDCTGPYGLVHVTGTLTAVYSRAGAGQVQVVITGSGVKVNKGTIDVNSTVLASKTAAGRRAEVTTDAKGTTEKGASIVRKGSYIATFDPATECAAIDGTWSTTIGLHKGETVVSGYKRCKGFCPQTGGAIVHTDNLSRALTVTVAYDGSAAAKWSNGKGRTGTVNLLCTPQS